MEEFYPGELPSEAFDVEHYVKLGVERGQAEKLVEYMRDQRIMMNDTYQVNIRHAPIVKGFDWPPMLHLSIKRRDRQPINDWRELQNIKNKVLGPEYEAVELFPAESRLVDTANQYHLFALADPTLRFPFGFYERAVATPEDAAKLGATQRAFE